MAVGSDLLAVGEAGSGGSEVARERRRLGAELWRCGRSGSCKELQWRTDGDVSPREQRRLGSERRCGSGGHERAAARE